jgi:Amt family ammonium transporter
MVVTGLLLIVTKVLVGLRVDEQTEQTGLDVGQHRERLA